MEDVIFQYTSEQAVEDGILFNIGDVNPAWKRGIFSHVTTNLLSSCGYLEEDGTIRKVNLVDLLNQCNEIVRKASDGFQKADYFYSGKIELPSGKRQEVFIELNENKKFTILLPEDH